ncbi:MAG TPA: hypothetical protein VKR32_17110 [Puia sp.]|nr:hypothetical protein [Puia sp.]
MDTNLQTFQELYDTLIASADRAWTDSQNPALKESTLNVAWQERAAAFEQAANLADSHCLIAGMIIKARQSKRSRAIEEMRHEESTGEQMELAYAHEEDNA